MPTSGLIMDQKVHHFLHLFSVNFGIILTNLFCRSFLSNVDGCCVKYIFTEIKELKALFNTFVFCLLQKPCFPVLKISLQIDFYQIKLFNDFMKEENH